MWKQRRCKWAHPTKNIITSHTYISQSHVMIYHSSIHVTCEDKGCYGIHDLHRYSSTPEHFATSVLSRNMALHLE